MCVNLHSAKVIWKISAYWISVKPNLVHPDDKSKEVPSGAHEEVQTVLVNTGDFQRVSHAV